MDKRPPFDGRRVVDLSGTVAGAYCARLLGDLGATVWKLEPSSGHPLRQRRRAKDGTGRPGALFRHLASGHRSVTLDADAAKARSQIEAAVPSADAVLWAPDGAVVGPDELQRLAPAAAVCALSDHGLSGPWAGRPSTELTLQAWCGGIASRGAPDLPPVQVGGDLGDWMTGMFAAVGVATSWFGDRQAAAGELLDVSKLEALALTITTMYPVTFESVMGHPFRHRRTTNVPDVHRAKDGYVGFMCVTGQQLLDFFAMIERVDWMDDPSLATFWGRDARRDELLAGIDSWVAERTVDEILELAGLLRVPAAPIGDGVSIPAFDHLVDHGFLRWSADKEFVEPAPTFWSTSYDQAPAPLPAPELGEATVDELAASRSADSRPTGAAGPGQDRLPFEGLRVLDFTAFWAGPMVGNYLAMLGADVIKVESASRLDGVRYQTCRTFDQPDWWEYAGLYHAANTNKRAVTIDMSGAAGRQVAERLVAGCDVVIENFSPRVLDGWDLGYDRLRELRDDVILLRMPAYGLEGPWRDWTGYAQTMEMVSGMVWMTGHPDGSPTVPNGPCDPIAGMHAALALIGALEQRARTGEGAQVISPMIGGALRVCSEQIIEATAYGDVRGRDGNRSPDAAPQGLYLCADEDADGGRDRWVAISVADDEQWAGLRRALGDPAWAGDPALATAAGRHRAHGELDRHLAEWCTTQAWTAVVECLLANGVPAAVAYLPHEAVAVEQLHTRGFFATTHHPLIGDITVTGYPALSSRVGPWRQEPAPLLGQHNRDVLAGVGGYTDEEIDDLEAGGAIGGLPSTSGRFTA